jgi:hypothetical protein
MISTSRIIFDVPRARRTLTPIRAIDGFYFGAFAISSSFVRHQQQL